MSEHKTPKPLTELNWLYTVSDVIQEHPEWLSSTMEAIQGGMLMRLKMEIALRARAETALLITYPLASKKIPSHQVEIVKRAIVNSGMYEGTTYAKKLAATLPKE